MEETNKISIEDLAWQMYQSGSLIGWEIEPFTREEFPTHSNYDMYIKAVKQVLSTGRIPHFKVSKPPTKEYSIIHVPASGNPVWIGGARSMYFVYSKDHGNFILEGYNKEVEEYLKKNYTHYFYRYTYWCDGQSRGGWKFWKETVGILEPSKSQKTWKYTIRLWTGGYKRQVTVQESDRSAIYLKRLPKRWIPEFNKF